MLQETLKGMVKVEKHHQFTFFIQAIDYAILAKTLLLFVLSIPKTIQNNLRFVSVMLTSVMV